MADIPQPAPEPYSVGERVRVYLGPTDTDRQFHGVICEVTDVLTDALDEETGRSLDAYSYGLKTVDDEEELPVSFRHRDLVPANED